MFVSLDCLLFFGAFALCQPLDSAFLFTFFFLFIVQWFLPVDILLGINSLGDKSVIQMIRKRKLDKDSVDLGVIVQSMDLGQQLELRDGRGQVEELKVHSGLFDNKTIAKESDRASLRRNIFDRLPQTMKKKGARGNRNHNKRTNPNGPLRFNSFEADFFLPEAPECLW